MQNYEMDKNGVFRHKIDVNEVYPMKNFVISKQKYRKLSIIESFLNTLILLCRRLTFQWTSSFAG